MKFRFLTSGESHGEALNVIIEGVPSEVKIDEAFVNNELAKRQGGYGRGGRMKIEKDKIKIKSGIRFGTTTGAPICIEIENKDFQNWFIPMCVNEVDLTDEKVVAEINSKKITKLRPGHADYAGAMKYNHSDVRNILERSSARETAARVVVGAVAKSILKEFNIKITSFVTQIGKAISENLVNLSFEEIENQKETSELACLDAVTEKKMKTAIDEAQQKGTTLGGKFEVNAFGVPVGLGSFVHWDRKLDAKLAFAMMSINAVKSVEIGDAQKAGKNFGCDVHDEIFYEDNKFIHITNNAGGIEGGMSNGETIIIKAVMKPIPTMKTPLMSVDLISKEPYEAHFERSDVCAVPSCAIVGESMAAIVLIDEMLTKFGGDSLSEMKRNYYNYLSYLENR